MPSCMFTAPAALPDDPATLQLILRAALTEIERLQLLVEKLQRMLFGSKSEKVLRQIEQLELQLEELQAAGAIEETQAVTPAAPCR